MKPTRTLPDCARTICGSSRLAVPAPTRAALRESTRRRLRLPLADDELMLQVSSDRVDGEEPASLMDSRARLNWGLYRISGRPTQREGAKCPRRGARTPGRETTGKRVGPVEGRGSRSEERRVGKECR